jgi:hypothetical protein
MAWGSSCQAWWGQKVGSKEKVKREGHPGNWMPFSFSAFLRASRMRDHVFLRALPGHDHDDPVFVFGERPSQSIQDALDGQN